MTLLYRSATLPAYSATSGTTIACPVSRSLSIGNAVVVIVHQKPSVANGGTVTTPDGFTLIGSSLAAGGYGASLAADTGNTNLFAFRRVIDGTEAWLSSDTMQIDVGTNSVASAVMLRFASGSGLWDFAAASGSDASGDGSVSVTFGADPGVAANDHVIVAFGVATDVSTPSQFSSHGLSQTGVTFAGIAEVVETDSANGNDIGGVIVRATVSAGTSSAAPVYTATAGGTTTNVRGPALFIRLRETSPVAITNPGIAADGLTEYEYLRLPIPTLGAATHTFYGWVYIPDADPTNSPGRMFTTQNDELRLVWDNPYNAWMFYANEANGSSQVLFARPGRVFIAVVYSATTVTIYWRREGQFELGRQTRSIAANPLSGTSTYLELGESGIEYEYWGFYEGALTEAQLLAQSQATTQLVPGRSWWSLVNASLTDSVGGHTAEVSGFQSGSKALAPAAIGTPDTTYATLIGERTSSTAAEGTAIYTGASPCSVTGGQTVSFWVRLPDAEINAYTVSLISDDEANAVIYVVQLMGSGATVFWSNLMSTLNGDTSVRNVSAGTNAAATGWVFIAWSQSNTGTNVVTSTYSAFGPDDTLTLRGSAEAFPTPEVFPNTMHLRVNVGNSAATGYNVRHLRIHNTALSQSQLADLMLSDFADTTAWAHYPLADGSFADASGNGRHLVALRDDGFRGIAGPVLTAGGTTADLAGTIAGAATQTGAVSGAAAVAGTAAGAATQTGAALASASLVATSAGTADQLGSLTGRSAAAGTSAGVATQSGAALGASALTATAAGTSTQTGALAGAVGIAGTSAGTATQTGDVTTAASAVLSGTSAGVAAQTGALLGRSAFSATSAGAATQSGGATGGATLGGTSAGVSTQSGALVDRVSFGGQSTGTVTATATALGSSTLAANTNGATSLVGAVVGAAAMVAVAAGLATSTANLSAIAAGGLASIVDCAATATGTLTGRSAGAGTSAGAANQTGALLGSAAATGTTAGAATTSAALTTAGQDAFVGVASGTSTPTGTLTGAAAFAGSSAGIGSQSGALASSLPFVGSSAGSSTQSGAVNLLAYCAATTGGTATQSVALVGASAFAGTSASASTQLAILTISGAGIVTDGTITLTLDNRGTVIATLSPRGFVTLTITG